MGPRRIKNALLLLWAVNYDTEFRTDYAAAIDTYEAITMDERQEKAESPVRADGRHQMRDVRSDGLPLIRPQAEAQIHHD